MNEFELGQVVCTRGIAEAMKKDRNLYLFILDALYGKYCKCDWGDTCEEDVFYANVAKIIGITVTDNTVYDCRKIRVTVPVQNCIFAYYKENGFSNAAISCNWLMRGPKADLTGDDLAFEVEDGFTSESGDLCAH